MKRIFLRTLGGLTMFLVAILCAFFAMRLAIHGREVSVPNLSGRTDSEAASVAKDLGLNLSVENRFYSSAVSLNHVLSQSPAAGSRVRRGWQVRVTESLGGQRVAVPDVLGQPERPAALILRRLQLELGIVAHLPSASPVGIVLAQSPPPNSLGLNGPQVGLLVSDGQSAPDTVAYVMPSIIGMPLASATARLATAGLRIAGATEPDLAPPPSPDANTGSDPGTATQLANGSSPATDQSFSVPEPPPISQNAVIVSQSPLPGHRVSRADNIRVTVVHPSESALSPF